jgi:diketogulonate reductase-like aldo/keto reductase
MPAFTLQDVLTLRTQPPVKIPRIGFGVYRSAPNQCVQSVLTALSLGYRHIDTAQFYENEAEVGEAVRKSGLPRSEVFVCTKIMNPEGGVEKTLEKCRESVKKIGLDWVDLFLIHSPSSGEAGRREMWEALEKLKEEGGAKSIGVSNL